MIGLLPPIRDGLFPDKETGMGDSSGFYKMDAGTLLFGPNFVESNGYKLTREAKASHAYPVDGWRWMESLEEARVFFGIPEPAEDGR